MIIEPRNEQHAADVVVLGAGLSGLAAARELTLRNRKVLVLEKSRGVGGRMATRRVPDGRGSVAIFDHGAQFFTARTRAFQSVIAGWENAGVARHWFDGYPSPGQEQPHDVYTRFCGSPGMTAIAKHLAESIDLHLEEEVLSLRRDDGIWTAHTKAGREYFGRTLLLTAPVPQSLELFATSGLSLPDAVRMQLDSISYEPCFTVLAILDGESSIPRPGGLYINEEPLSWMSDNFQKSVSPHPGAVTILSSSGFARAHYGDDQTAIGKQLIAAAQPYLGRKVLSFQVRRWRYAKAINTLDVGALHVPELSLCFAGDGLCGARVEGAYNSGVEAAALLSASGA
jgi:predicted NAD/FAD-dependent oxidoreductase